MSVTAKTNARPLTDAEIVEAYLTASMIPDPDAAAAYMKPGTVITFTGGREFDHPRGPTGFNARRYRWLGLTVWRSLGRYRRAGWARRFFPRRLPQRQPSFSRRASGVRPAAA